MNNFHAYLTPKELLTEGSGSTLEELTATAKRKTEKCMNCDEQEWKLAGCGLCFSCTTGEADASEDYEIKSESGA